MSDLPLLLEVNDLCVGYGKVGVLQDVNLFVPQGQIVTVIGPNGAGKTTMLASMMGLLQPTRGRVRFMGKDVGKMDVEDRVALGMNLVPESRALFGEMSVGDNLQMGSFMRHRLGYRDHKETLSEVFSIFPRLEERRAQKAATLSGGERQMLAIGRALMGKPRLLMLDEPSLGLAPLIVREILHIISELKKTGVSILLVEQNARAALQIADYGYVLEMGEVALEGASKDLIHDSKVVDSYLGLGVNH